MRESRVSFKNEWVILFVMIFILVVLSVSSAFALGNPITAVKDWLSSKFGAVILTYVIGSLGLGGYILPKIFRTFKEAGEFFSAIGEAYEDKEITNEEIGIIFSEARDIFCVWKKSDIEVIKEKFNVERLKKFANHYNSG